MKIASLFNQVTGAVFLLTAFFLPSQYAAANAQNDRLDGYQLGDTLSPMFDEQQVNALYDAFVVAKTRAKKGEFETTQEHEARLADLSTLLSPFDPAEKVVLPIGGARVKYDADSKNWLISSSFPYGCRLLFSKQRLYQCPSTTLRFDGGSYIGQNAYGASREVEVTSTVQISFVASEKWIEQSGAYKDDIGGHVLETRLPMSLNEAQQLGSGNLQAFIVGTIATAEMLTGKTEYQSPTFSDPQRRLIQKVTLPVLPMKMIFVNAETGEIVGEVNPWGY